VFETTEIIVEHSRWQGTSLTLATTMSINPFSLSQQTSDHLDLFGEDEGVAPARTVTSYASLTAQVLGLTAVLAKLELFQHLLRRVKMA
jgi:hypothetical protein